MNKKGDLPARYMVIFIVLVASAAIVFFFYGLAFPDSTEINKQVCHESIIFRHTLNVGPIEAGKESINLRCETEKICLTNSDSECPSLGEKSKDNPITIAKLDKNLKTEVLDEVSDAILDCNGLLGEGHLNFMPTHAFTENYCFACARLSFDEETAKEVGKIGYLELYEHMSGKTYESDVSYLEKLYGFNDPSRIGNDLARSRFEGVDFDDWTFDLKDDYIVVGMASQKGEWFSATTGVTAGIFLTGAGIAASAFTGGGSLGLTAVGIGLISGTAVGSAIYWQTFPDNEDVRYATPFLYPYEVDYLKGLDCTFEFIP